MKASELRIGNLVKKGNDLCTVKGYYDNLFIVEDTEKIEFKSNVFDNLKPIPLTEEWLLKFGFVKSKVSSQFDKEKLTIQIANELEYHKKGRVYFNSWAILESQPKYVHELQNIFFALTGEELTISNAN